jgi:hypothetical protein
MVGVFFVVNACFVGQQGLVCVSWALGWIVMVEIRMTSLLTMLK